MEKTPWEKILDWLERVLPTAIAAFALGYRQGKRDEHKTEAKLARTEYELEKMQNAEEVRKENSGKSSRDIVDDYLEERRKRGEK